MVSNIYTQPHTRPVHLAHQDSCRQHKGRLTSHVEDAVTGTNVGEECISKTLSRVGTLYQSSNVHHIEESRHLTDDKDARSMARN